MICPKCDSGEIDDSGTCPECGFTAPGPSEAEAEHQAEGDAAHVGLIPMDYSSPSDEAGGELPAWRQELSRRLQEIKRKREGGDHPHGDEEELPPVPSPRQEQPAGRARATEEMPKRRPSRPRPVPPGTPDPAESLPVAPPDLQSHPATDLTVPSRAAPSPPETPNPEPAAELPVRHPPGASPKQANIQDLIDSIMTKKSAQPEAPPRVVPVASVPDRHGEGKLILLSRTLSGLVDLLIVILCTGAYILAADFISGIEVLDQASLFHYGELLLAIFLLYSIFMLATANQTIGMMITDLRVVSTRGERPSIGQVVARTLAFLVSLLPLGIGLIWAVFDRKSLCLHDRISGTEVVRM
jgi:uncharacterized RDD family membrane protein YckC